MDLRLALHELAAQHQLDASSNLKLQQLAGLNREPARLAYWLPRGVAVLAASWSERRNSVFLNPAGVHTRVCTRS